ncbi:MAG: transcription termination factor Rho [Planctomycetota bacterium]
MAVNSSGSTDSDPEAPPRRRRTVKKKTESATPAEAVRVEPVVSTPEPEAAPRPTRRRAPVRRPEPEQVSDSFGFDPEEFLPPAVVTERPERPARERPVRERRPRAAAAETPRERPAPVVEEREEVAPARPERAERSEGRTDRSEGSRSQENYVPEGRIDSGDSHGDGGEEGSFVEGGEGGADNGQEGDFQRRRRRRRRSRNGRVEGQAPVQSAPRQNQPRSNPPAGGGAPRHSNNGGSNVQRGRPQRSGGGGRFPNQGGGGQGGQGGQQRDRGYNRDNNRGGSNSGGGGGRDNFRDRNTMSEQAMADIPGTEVSGVLELHPKGYGFLRDPSNNYASSKTDAFVSGTLIERCSLREGVLIKGEAIPGPKGQGPRLKSVESVEGRTVEEYQKIKTFDTLTAINPHEQIVLETGPMPITMRVMDLLCPIGKGQRALIVAPPRTGKTMLLQDIANSVSKNHPEMYLIVLLIDERPEEVTEMRRNVRGEVIASSMDRDVESHVRISQLIIERGKRIAESGGEVFILLDSITRTARAFNKWVGSSGRTTSGGLDVKALDIPKKMFGTARLFDEGGSLTIAATALIETGSRMDDVIFQEFKGTGNMEMVLSRNLADRRIWPSIDIQQSGTRREEKILSPETLEGVTMLRRSLLSLSPVEGMEQLTRILQKYPSNKEFLGKIRSIL